MSFEVRLAKVEDLEDINKLIWSPGVKWFGNIRLRYRGKKSLFQTYQTYRVVARSKTNSDLLAYAEFRNYPAVSAMPSDCWMEWLSVRYCLNYTISWLNALFCNFCIYKSDYPSVLAEIIKVVFFRENRVTYLIIVRTPKVRQPKHLIEAFDDLEELSKVFYPREYSLEKNNNTQSLYIVDRCERLPKILYRKALAEDNDDIIAIHEVEMPEMREELGDYYIAEEIMSQSPGAEKNLLVVGEISNQNEETEIAVFLWVSTDIDIRFYVHTYDVESFGNLVKTIDGGSVHFEQLPVYSVKRRAPASMFTVDALLDLQNMTILGGFQRFDSSMSLASTGKIRINSIEGNIVEPQHHDDQNKFYLREVVHSKFKYIINKLSSNDYYTRHEKTFINFLYPAGEYPAGPKAIEAASNVFLLKCIVAREGFPLPRLISCLVATFSANPDKDYCIMVMNKKNRNIRSHLGILSYFMPVIRRPSSILDMEEVYITHRSTIFGEVGIYEMMREDIPVVLGLAKGKASSDGTRSQESLENCTVTYCAKVNERAELEKELQVLEDIMTDVLENDFSEFMVFTIRCGNSTKSVKYNTPIGYVVLRQFHSHSKLSEHYHLPRHENHLDHLRAEIISLRLHPLFLVSSEQIFRDLARKTNFFDFYFISSFHKSKFGNDLKKMMMVLEPRPIKKGPVTFKLRKEVASSTGQFQLPEPDFAKDVVIIYRHLLKPNKWFTNSKKIVIIGFTEISKAFLRRLIFQWNTKDFSNLNNYTCLSWPEVTVICSPGVMEAEYDSLFECPYCSDYRGCYLTHQNVSCYVRDCVWRMDMRYWVHFVPGKVQAINREEKFVKLMACEIYYDSLLLMCDRMFVLKVPSSEKLVSSPCNFVQINFRVDKILLFYKLRAVLEDLSHSYLILVYGNNLSTYECIAFLLSHGVHGSRIVLIQPHRSAGYERESKLKNPYWDNNVQAILDDILEDSGVKILGDYFFHHWVLNDTGDFIMQVVFHHFARHTEVNYECDIFISFEEGYLKPRDKRWMESSGLDIDGDDILVNERFQTNDLNIYAVGKYIKLRRECNYQYKYVSARECAYKLLHHLGIAPLSNFEDRFSDPVLFQAGLPLDYFITKITLPRRYLASQQPFNYILNRTTYKDNTFCRVGLSQTMVVDEIVVVTKKKCYLDFLLHFCGKHESLLNNLKARYEAKTIDDFLEWFQQGWTELIMHENFKELQVENRAILKTMALAAQKKNVNRGPFQDVTDHDFYMLNKRYVEQKLLGFLREHRADFKHRFALPEDFLAMNPYSWNSSIEQEEQPPEKSDD